MKTIEVTTTKQENPRIETHYAYNGNYGIETTQDEDTPAWCPEAVQCTVKVATLFPGTIQEWNQYIHECIVDALKDAGLTEKCSYADFLIEN